MRKNRIGFDLGGREVKMLQLMTGGEIRRTAAVELPDDLISEGRILSMDAMADFIRATPAEQGIPRGDCGVILPPSLMFVRNVTMPVMTERQLKYNLPYEFRDYLKEEKSQYLYDYAVREILRDEEGKPKEMRILACATLKSTVEDYTAMFRRAGFRLKTAVPEEYALGRIFEKYGQETGLQNQEFCLVDLGHQQTRGYFFRNGETLSKRTVELGGREIDRVIAEVCDVDVHMAHAYKLSNYNDILNHERCQMIYHQIAVEIMKAVNFFNYNNRSAELKRIYLCGGGAKIAALVKEIRNIPDLEVCLAGELMGQTGEGDRWMYFQAYAAAAAE